MTYARTAERVRKELIRVCQAGLDSQTLRRQALSRLSKALPIDAFFCAAADPATLLFTGSVLEGIPEGATPEFLRNEFLQDDVNKFVGLARGRRHVSTLVQATDGNIAASPRYTDLLAPMGLGDELRAAIVSGATCWGFMCLHRQASSPGFTPAECAYLASLLPHLAEGLRRALLLERIASTEDADGPGLLILAEDWSLVSSTPAAERWLAEVSEVDWPGALELPVAVYTVAASLRLAEQTGRAPQAPQRVQLRTSAGRWLTLHASRLAGPSAPGQVAIIVEPARPQQLAPLIAQVYALSPRESEIARLVLHGLTTAELAAQLAISPLTVQDHVKAIFDKVGVRSRRELAARIFADHYRPKMPRAGEVAGWRLLATSSGPSRRPAVARPPGRSRPARPGS
jgi:DNA-binding CsgD family transcriptional regulator